MEGKRTTTSMVIMSLLILSITVSSAMAAQCSCCKAARAKACCFACIAAGGSNTVCKNTCCFPCLLSDSGKFTRLSLFNVFDICTFKLCIISWANTYVAFHAISLMYFVDFTFHLTTSSVLHATGRHLILYFHCKINSCAN